MLRIGLRSIYLWVTGNYVAPTPGTFLRPGGVDTYFRPASTDIYIR